MHSDVSFPGFGITDIIATLQEIGVSFVCRTQLNVFTKIDVKTSLRVLYHCAVYPSGPGDLLVFSLVMAFLTSVVIADINVLF